VAPRFLRARRARELDLLDAPLVPAPVEPGAEPRVEDALGLLAADEARGSTRTFASLCCRASAAISGAQATAARTCA
jgi:hypothetical protein